MPYENVLVWIREIPDHLKTQEMCDVAVGFEPRSLAQVPYFLKTQEMRNEAVGRDPYTLGNVSDHFMTQEMCNEAMCKTQQHFFLSLIVLKNKKNVQ